MWVVAGHAQDQRDFQLGAGDSIRIVVFQNPDLSLETRVSENGAITYPLIGTVQVGGLSLSAAEARIAQGLKDGGFVQQPQVNIVLVTIRGNQVAVLGLVNRPGRYPLETANTRLSEIIATAGGVIPNAGSGTAVLVGVRDGKYLHKEVDVAALFLNNRIEDDLVVSGGDAVYVSTGNQVSILGQVNRPGRYPLENFTMRLSEVLSLAGGIAQTGSDSIILSGKRQGQAYRKEVDLASLFLNNKLEDDVVVAAGDEIYVHRAPMFYIYGEVQRPGSFRVERGMTLIQALAQGGGLTVRGTERNIQLHRRNAKGDVEKLSAVLTDNIQADDVIYVRESLF
jgi:polysaccharide export outer membrane protein